MEATYDYIITGGGAAGRSLICHILQSELKPKRILFIDREPKQENDRTWCFWERSPGLFEEIVYHAWDKLWVHTDHFSRLLSIAPYRYKLIRGIDFYEYTDALIDRHPYVDRLYADVEQITNIAGGVQVRAAGQHFVAYWCFNSIFFGQIDKTQVNYLDQHFRGWFIRSAAAVFDPAEAKLMDFRTPQKQETRFLYVLPYNPYEALIEVAIFSNRHLPIEAYDELIRTYIGEHLMEITDYTIQQTEMGNIPMTDYPFPQFEGRIIHLGMAGGDTRASSGYTFYNIQRRSAALVQQLLHTGSPTAKVAWPQQRARFYDQLLLRVLEKGYYPGDALFARLFSRNEPRQVLAFLNAETSMAEEILLTTSLPKSPFLRALWEKITQ